MRNVCLSVILMLISLKVLQGQELPKNVKILDKDSINTGTYLFKKNKSEQNSDWDNQEYLKRYSRDLFVIEISESTDREKFSNGKLYSITNEWKLSPHLRKKNIISPLLLSVHITKPEIFKENSNFQILQQHDNFFILKATSSDLDALLAHPHVTHISEYQKPVKEAPVSFYDLSVNKINLAHYNFPEIDGEGLRVSVKEESLDTTDIDLKNRYEIFGLEDPDIDQHAGLIATLIAGGGNSGSRSRGVAPAAFVSSSSFVNIFPAASSYYMTNEIYVENHSYGGAIETEYGNEAAAYDQVINEVPQLVHVFSSGNSGLEAPETGPYAGVEGFANLTGNFKMAKNIITVGAINKEKEILARSSKGPANDGRVKPELVAYAEIGTSDAAALVSGTTLLLQDLYFEKENKLPTVDLVKAVLIAAAEDVGPPNVDYSSGYGNLDANRSLEIINAGSYFNGIVGPDETITYNIDISEGATELKVALSWIDPAAMPGDEVTLINDLNLRLTGPDGTLWLPWVLDGTDGETIVKPAVRGRDSLNPVELVTIKYLAPGNYTVEVSAEDLSGTQDFSIAFTTSQKRDFTWTFPTAIDAVTTAEETFIRWEETFPEGPAKIEYRYGNEDWELIDASVDLESEAFKWNVPTRSGLVQLRMTIDSEEFLSAPFAVSPELSPQVLYNCEDEVLFAWNKVEGATGYALQNLGSRYMEQLEVLEDTIISVPKENLSSEFVSVIPLFEGIPGRSGIAINYKTQGVNCYFQNFFALLGEEPVVNATLNLSTTFNIEKVEFVRRNNGITSTFAEFSPPFSSNQFVIMDEDVQDGINLYSAVIHLKSGGTVETNEISIYLPGQNTLTVYPNPVQSGEELNVVSRGDDLDLEIFDMQGQKVVEDELLRFLDRIEISIPTRGLYIIRATRKGKEVGVQKVIVK